MAIYDCRREGRHPDSKPFGRSVRIVDAATGERIANVFFAQTAPAKLGRCGVGPDGEPLVDPKTRRKVMEKDEQGRDRCRIVYDRLEVWEIRPWKAVAIATGEVVVKSEGAA